MERHLRGEDLASYYEGLLDDQESSGLSVVEFAEEAGVSSATLYAWRRRLSSEESKPKLVEVSMAREAAESPNSKAISLTIDDRFRVEIEPEFDERALERLLSVLARC